MNVVLPFWSGDADRAIALLQWALHLDQGRVPFTGILLFDTATDPVPVGKVAEQYFQETKYLRIDAPQNRTWPRPQNHFFQRAAWELAMNKTTKGVPWLWWETDAWPLAKGWLSEIKGAYQKGGNPFMGAIVQPSGYMAGVGVYPGDVTVFLRDALLIQDVPWDVVAKADMAGKVTDASALIQHERNGDKFRAKEHLERIRPGVVLYHRCKDTSLMEVLRGLPVTQPHAVETPTERIIQAVTIAQPSGKKRSVCIHREGAIGDVIMASGVARRMAEDGHDVSLWCSPKIAPLFAGDELLLTVDTAQYGQELIELDGCYEGHPKIKTVSKPSLMAEKCGIAPLNIAPKLGWRSSRPREWKVAISPRSNSWPIRTVPKEIWNRVSGHNLIWVGTDPAPKTMIDAKCHTMEGLARAISECSLLVTVDTGPMHIAAALGIPVIAIKQACSPELHLSDQRDYKVISTELECLNCHGQTCPVNQNEPPCGFIRPALIMQAIAEAKETAIGHRISAIIPVYNPNPARLNQCLRDVLPQVDEVIISVDGNGVRPEGVINDLRIKWLANPTGERRGFGKTCNYAARHSSGRYLLMLNDDVYLQPTAVAHMKKVMMESERVGVVGAFLRYPDGRIQHAGTVRGTGAIGWGHLDHGKHGPSITQVTEMENVTHACALIRRTAFYEAMAYDEEFDCYWEDNALNLAIRQRGYKVMYQPAATGVHEESQTSSPIKEALASKGQKVFERKWAWYFDKNRNPGLGTF